MTATTTATTATTAGAVDRPPGAEPVPPLPRSTVLLMAGAVGAVVANLFYAQPLEDTLARAFDVSTRSVGLAVTLVQVSYAVGLATVVPLGDLVERRRLLAPLLGCTVVGLGTMAAAPSYGVFLVAAVIVGASSVAVQIIVPFAAHLAAPSERGRVVSTVMSGLLLGVLVSRTVAGLVSDAVGWRAVFGLGAVVTAGVAALLLWRLPALAPTVTLRYPALLASVVRMVRDEPELRLRMFYGGLVFASFSAFWTSAGFMLAGPAYDWSDGAIGAFALVGVAGALAAKFAGRLADRGRVQLATGGFLMAMALSYVLLALGERSVIALVVGVAVMDLGCQGVHIRNQSVIYALRPEARSRINTAYMTSYFVAGSAGSALSAVVYPIHGWAGVCAIGGVLPALAAGVWVARSAAGSTVSP
jgi:predicted MFS family arabinose efflux permease